MIYTPTAVEGAFVLEPERFEDERGFFARTWDGGELAARGLDGGLVQSSISWNGRRGTLRGLHYQAAPAEETKIVRCTAGSIHDVVLDRAEVSAALQATQDRLSRVLSSLGFQSREADYAHRSDFVSSP